MRTTGLALLALLIGLPGVASAQGIVGSRHDFRAGQTYSANVGATTNDQICIYCHTPHHAGRSVALWNHTASAQASYTWSDMANTTAGTSTTFTVANGHSSALCLACHDGTVAIGSVSNAGSGVPGTIALTGTSVNGSGQLAVGSLGNLAGAAPGQLDHNHPVGIPYPGEGSYGGRASSVLPADIGVAGGYRAASGTTPRQVVNGANTLNLSTVAGGGWGVECATCHDPHNSTANTNFLRVTLTGSTICLTCHQK